MIIAQINGLLAFWKPVDIDANCFLKCASTRVFFLTGTPCGSKAHYRLFNFFSAARYYLTPRQHSEIRRDGRISY